MSIISNWVGEQIIRIISSLDVAEPIQTTRAPTPLDSYTLLGKQLGVELLIKREDRIDDFASGNKVRKLAYITAEALRQKSSVLVTTGSLPSNQCKAVALVARRHGLRAHVVYGGDKQSRPTHAHGNYFFTSLLQPTITWLERVPWVEMPEKLSRIVEEEQKNGARPFLIPSGASSWPGILGSLELGFELVKQVEELGSDVTDVVVPAGSGGTCLGIQIAAELAGMSWNIWGICIGAGKHQLQKEVLALKAEFAHRCGGPLDTLNLSFDESALGSGYDMPTTDELNLARTILQDFNLILDQNYMLKAFIGMKSLIRTGQIKSGSKVILVHTGGQMGIFDAGQHVTKWHDASYPEWISTQTESKLY